MANSIVELFQETVAAHGERPAARYKDGEGTWHTKTWTEMGEDRKVIASALIALGLKAGERVNILSNSSYRWMLADVAVMSAGATPVAIYQSLLDHEVEYIVDNSDAVMMFVEDKEQLDKVLAVKGNLPNIRKIITMDDTAHDSTDVLTWSEAVHMGREQFKLHEGEIQKRSAALTPDDVLTLIYTSGTTGKPKGVILTHENLMYEAKATSDIGLVKSDDVQLLFLPMAHSFARCLQCVWLGTGHEMAIDSEITQIVPNLAIVRPTVMASVPRIFEKVYAKVTGQGLAAPGLKGKMFKWALELNDKYSMHMTEGTPVPGGLQLQMNIAKSLVYSKIGERLSDLFGGRLNFFISGGAPLSKKMAYFFNNAGVTILEGYGLTETSAATTVNRPEKNKIGTVGKPVPGTEIKIASDGEILIKGPGVMRGYYKRDDATKEVLLPDGWFATGDIGVIDQDGYLRITDRKKDIIVTAGGKNVAPQNIEGAIKAANPLISQVMVYGDKRKYLSALVTLEAEALATFGKDRGISGDYEALTRDADVKAFVQTVLDKVNGELPRYETIKKFEILDKDFTIGDELTPTLKVKRKHATTKYMDLLATMYDEPIAQ